MSLSRTFVLNGDAPANALWAFLRQNWRAMQEQGRPLAVTVCEHKERRSPEQNERMWKAILQPVSEQAWVAGQQFSPEVWHELFKREFLPDEEGPTKRCRKGYKKWAYLPDGSRVLVGSTTMLTTFGMAEYQTKIEAYATQELGVRFVVQEAA